MITHEQLLFNLAMLQEAFRQTEDSIIVNWVPHFHDLGLIVHICHAMYVGASCITMDPLTFVARPLSWLETISKYRGTFSGAPNFGYDICANKVTAAQAQSLDLRSWEVAVNAGEPVRAQTIERFSSQFALSGFPVETMSPAYGLAEATAIVTGDRGFFPRGLRCLVAAELNRGRVVELPQHAPEGRWVVGCGRSVGGEVIAIVDPDNRTRCPSGTVGEIWVSSRAVASGYWQKPVETETTFRARIAEEAASDERTYLRTGDLGFVLDEQLYITGRLKDTLVVHGAVHYPQDIEQSVEAAHPAFRRSGSTAAFQVDAGDGEERLVVLQEVEPNQVTPEAFATCVQTIRNVVADHHGLFVNTVCLLERGGVLKTTSGKIRRAACRTALLDNKLPILVRSDTTPTETSSNDPSLTRDKLLTLVPADRVERLESYVLQQLAAALQLAPDQARGLRPELSLLSQGMDSLMATTLAERIQKALGVTLRLDDLLLGASAAQTAMKIAELLEDEEETLI